MMLFIYWQTCSVHRHFINTISSQTNCMRFFTFHSLTLILTGFLIRIVIFIESLSVSLYVCMCVFTSQGWIWKKQMRDERCEKPNAITIKVNTKNSYTQRKFIRNIIYIILAYKPNSLQYERIREKNAGNFLSCLNFFCVCVLFPLLYRYIRWFISFFFLLARRVSCNNFFFIHISVVRNLNDTFGLWFCMAQSHT